MTNKEALQANIAQIHGVVLSDNAFSKALIDEGISDNIEYNKVYEKLIDMATVRLLKVVLGTANMSEGGLSYSITNKEYIEHTIDSLLVKWGMAQEFNTIKSKPTVTGASLW